MVQVFVKTVALVVALGLLHGLVVLPIIYAWIPFNKFDPSGKKYDDAVKRSSHPRLGPTKIAIRSSPEVVKRISADGKVTTTESDVMTVVTSPETVITKQPLARKDSSRG
ncbi:hypothetical protein AAVH_38357 [Aphelenchoides avenae]|nr:hypothetical protein AAVH_38357 [Aphelenchus avenae]